MKESIDLGLALLSVLRKPGECLTCEDIAAFCDCTHEAIAQIERRALAKLRVRAKQMGSTFRKFEKTEVVFKNQKSFYEPEALRIR